MLSLPRLLAAAAAAAVAPSAAAALGSQGTYITALGDPMLRSNAPAVMLTGWNFCNMAKAPAAYPTHPSPRWADCASTADNVTQLVSAVDNALGPGDAFPLPGFNATTDVNAYAVEKGLFLAQVCSRAPASASTSSVSGVGPSAGAGNGASSSGTGTGTGNWSYHTIMLKSGNMDTAAGICPETVSSSSSAPLGFNNLPMNQPLVSARQARVQPVPYGGSGFVGWFAGTYDVDPTWTPAQTAAVQAALDNYTASWTAYRFAELDGVSPLPPRPDSSIPPLLANRSYVAAIYYKNVTSGSTVFFHIQSTSKQAPWLMNYFKLMDAAGVGGGYDWPEGGQMFGPVPSYFSRLSVTYRTLDEAKGGFGGLYVPCHGGCWKLDGSACDGDLDTDITRYICFVAESGTQGCSQHSQGQCPPFHVLSGTGERVYPNDTARFPYSCYSGHCPPGGCDPYSNPGPQELMMLLPCAEWAEHGYPSNASQYSGTPMTLDVGAIGARVALSGAEPPDVGPAVRAARGWAPLPPPGTLPPYPGWTRSWVGFDFGQEQPNPGLVRYEWTAIDLEVLAAAAPELKE